MLATRLTCGTPAGTAEGGDGSSRAVGGFPIEENDPLPLHGIPTRDESFPPESVVRSAGETTLSDKAHAMLRSCFFSIGLFIALWGVTLLFIDQLVLNSAEEGAPESTISAMISSAKPDNRKVVDPPDWAAFSMMSVGAVTMLYAAALPKKEG